MVPVSSSHDPDLIQDYYLFDDDNDDDGTLLTQTFLKRYIAFAKTKNPKFRGEDDKICEYFRDAYAYLSSRFDGLSRARVVNSMIRISEAHAKAFLRDTITTRDIDFSLHMLKESCWNYSGCIGTFDEDFKDILFRSSLAFPLEKCFIQRVFDRSENFIPDFKQTTTIVSKKFFPESTQTTDEIILFGDCSRKRSRSVYESDYESHYSDQENKSEIESRNYSDYDQEQIKLLFEPENLKRRQPDEEYI